MGYLMFDDLIDKFLIVACLCIVGCAALIIYIFSDSEVARLTIHVVCPILFIVGLYYILFNSKKMKFVAGAAQLTLAELKAQYLALDDSAVSYKGYYETIIDNIGIKLDIHPHVRTNYKAKIKTTINLDAQNRYVDFRSIQRQMRIDAVFAMTTYDDTKVERLI